MNGNAHTHTQLQDDTKLLNGDCSEHVGITLDERASNKPDPSTKITASLGTASTLNNLWNHNTHPKYAIRVVIVVFPFHLDDLLFDRKADRANISCRPLVNIFLCYLVDLHIRLFWGEW